MPSKYVQVDGVATFLQHTGTTTLPEAPPLLNAGEVVLCVHASGGNGAVFRPLLRALSAAHSPLAFDLPGHGRSGGLDSLGSIEQMAAFTGALADKLGLRPYVMLGEGMGAAVAVEVALARPETVRALVLCSGDTNLGLDDERLEGLRRVTEGKARREFDRSGFSPGAERAVYERAFREWLKTDPRATYGDERACRQWQAGERLAALSVPALVVAGADDEGSRAGSDRLAAAIPGAPTRTKRLDLAGAGRRISLEQPGGLADAVQEFLGELAP